MDEYCDNCEKDIVPGAEYRRTDLLCSECAAKAAKKDELDEKVEELGLIVAEAYKDEEYCENLHPFVCKDILDAKDCAKEKCPLMMILKIKELQAEVGGE